MNSIKNPADNNRQDFLFGGEKGIRTPERVLAVTRFPIVRLRPAQPSLHNCLKQRKLLYYILLKKSSKTLNKVLKDGDLPLI